MRSFHRLGRQEGETRQMRLEDFVTELLGHEPGHVHVNVDPAP